jgi:hypothetical protein
MTLHQYFLTFDTLNKTQWHLSCTLLDSIINNISFTIQKTCSATSIIPLIHTTAQQGGCLPCKIQKLWKTHLSTYHLIHKAIYITQHNPTWYNHPLILNLHNHKSILIPTHVHLQTYQEWLTHISS